MKISDRYLKIVEWSEEDNCYVGISPGLIYGGVHGDNEIEVYKHLIQAVEDAIELYQQDGKPLPPPTLNPESLKILSSSLAAGGYGIAA